LEGGRASFLKLPTFRCLEHLWKILCGEILPSTLYFTTSIPKLWKIGPTKFLLHLSFNLPEQLAHLVPSIQGLDDLHDGIIRTPLDPLTTFTDDPLRALRVVRFASRFGFEIEEKTFQALSSDIALNGIRNKVSRERIGKELEKMLKGYPSSCFPMELLQFADIQSTLSLT